MKIQEAKEIVGYILQWQFLMLGVKNRDEMPPKMDLSKYSLNDLIKANNMVETDNLRKRKMQEYHAKKGHKTNGVSQHMTLSDRAIAAVYVCMNHKPNGEMVALIDDVGCGCVIAKYEE